MNAQQQNLERVQSPQTETRVFGIPLGDLGFFTSLLMALTVGFLSFFLFTFLAIVGVGIWNGMGHHVDFADTYKYISFPAACVVLAASLIFFGSLWVRRKVSGG
jgi:hypothetical protein